MLNSDVVSKVKPGDYVLVQNVKHTYYDPHGGLICLVKEIRGSLLFYHYYQGPGGHSDPDDGFPVNLDEWELTPLTKDEAECKMAMWSLI